VNDYLQINDKTWISPLFSSSGRYILYVQERHTFSKFGFDLGYIHSVESFHRVFKCLRFRFYRFDFSNLSHDRHIFMFTKAFEPVNGPLGLPANIL
jgi:hypothetical protein